MNELNITILDDEETCLHHLQNLCKIYFNEKKRNCTFRIFKNPKDLINEDYHRIDLLLLDIEMPSINGLELATQIREINKKCFICFITNYSDYLYQSYDVHAFDYILKPVTKDSIFHLLDDVMKYLNIQNQFEDQQIYFNSKDGKIHISLNQIYYLEYFDKYENIFNRVTKLYTTTGNYIIKEKIGDLYNQLPKDIFIIPHKSFIININQIKQIKQNEILLQNNDVIPLSQKRSASIRKLLYERFLMHH